MKLFDLDGTLIDSNGVWLQIDLDFLSRRSLPYTPEYSDTVAHSIFPMAARFTKDYFSLSESPEEIMAEWMAMAREEYARKIPLKPGAGEFVAREFRKGERLAIVTASVPELCALVLEHHGMAAFFDQIVFAQELGMEKRDPRFFSEAVKLLGVTAPECTMYEDAPENCAAAKAAGLTVVGVYDTFFAPAEPRMRGLCDRYILSFDELL